MNEEYKKLIYSVMKYFPNYKNKEDLFQAGCIGLLYAYRNYNNEYNCKFTTYAYTYILGEMRKLVREDKSIKINRDIISLNYKIEKARDYLYQLLSMEPTTKQIANYLEIDEYFVVEAMKSINCVESLENDYKYGIKDENIELIDALDDLTEFEKELINSRYFNGYTQSETAKILNTNQVKISRDEKKILIKLKNKLTC